LSSVFPEGAIITKGRGEKSLGGMKSSPYCLQERLTVDLRSGDGIYPKYKKLSPSIQGEQRGHNRKGSSGHINLEKKPPTLEKKKNLSTGVNVGREKNNTTEKGGKEKKGGTATRGGYLYSDKGDVVGGGSSAPQKPFPGLCSFCPNYASKYTGGGGDSQKPPRTKTHQASSFGEDRKERL